MAKTETKQKGMPTGAVGKSDESLLTPVQQTVLKHIRSAPQDPPKMRIEDIRDRFHRVEMEVPKSVIKGPEYSYAWLSIEKLNNGGYEGSKWAVVTRSNHSHAPESIFSLKEGGILYGGQNILAFCYKEVRDAEQAVIIKDYNQKTERATETKEVVGESAAVVDPAAAGKVFSEQVINPDEGYDFEAPQ
jgi:hypothetical protein